MELPPAIEALDRKITLALNGMHAPAMDTAMVFASDKHVWFPLYAVLIGWLIYLYRHRTWLLLPLLISAVALADTITSRLFKPFFGRLRPCHDALLQPLLHLPDGCGGQFGFLSSHAANSFALATFLLLVLPRGRYRWVKGAFLLWAAVLSFSRVYLGAHYLTDVLGGILIGTLLATVAARVFLRYGPRWQNPKP